MRKLGRDVFMTLAAVGWADGNLDPEEAEGIRRAAVESGLSLEEIDQIEDAIKTPATLDRLDRTKLDAVDRTFVYATAVWLARLDGCVAPEERAVLKKLGDLLNIPDGVRSQASAAALEVAQLPSGDRPARYDFHRRRLRVEKRLARILKMN
ncbi:MAG: hypothetical protein NVSMB1_24600 [Polyangiales bacterium]